MVVLTRLAIASQAQDFFSFFFRNEPSWLVHHKKKMKKKLEAAQIEVLIGR
jgi:hypothetical protein